MTNKNVAMAPVSQSKYILSLSSMLFTFAIRLMIHDAACRLKFSQRRIFT